MALTDLIPWNRNRNMPVPRQPDPFTALRREMYERVAERWASFGLPGQAPSVRAFETDQPVVYHEEGSFEPGRTKAEEPTE